MHDKHLIIFMKKGQISITYLPNGFFQKSWERSPIVTAKISDISL